MTIPEEEITLEEATQDQSLLPKSANGSTSQSHRKILAGSPLKQRGKSSRKNCAVQNAMSSMKNTATASMRSFQEQSSGSSAGPPSSSISAKSKRSCQTVSILKTEKYNVGDRVQALLLEVRDTENGGAEVILSRSHPEFVAQLFMQEVPEINDGTITIEKIVTRRWLPHKTRCPFAQILKSILSAPASASAGTA